MLNKKILIYFKKKQTFINYGYRLMVIQPSLEEKILYVKVKGNGFRKQLRKLNGLYVAVIALLLFKQATNC